MPQISIVLPSFNGEKYIEYSINSIIGQTHKDWELILVDDCSTDSTLEIMEKYSELDSRIRVIHNKENHKLPMSLNLGFREAKGEFFTWTSDDNIYEPNAIEKMVEAISASDNVGMVCANMMIINEKGEEKGIETTYSGNLCLSNTIGACFLYKREAAENIGEYDTSLFLVEDYDYWLRLEEKYKIVHIDDILYKYRRHGGSLSERRINQVAESRYRLRVKHETYILQRVQEDRYGMGVIFCENYLQGGGESYLNREIAKILPEYQPLLSQEKKYSDVIIFGAGNYGRRCVPLIHNRILFFLDNDKSIMGTQVEGYDVRGVNSLLEVDNSVCVIIAVSTEVKPYIIKQLFDMGHTNYDILF